MSKNKISKNPHRVSLQKGSGLVEILVAVFIITIILGSLITVAGMYLANSKESLKSAQGAYLASEGVEAMKTIRDISWNNISGLNSGTNYYLYFDTSSSTNHLWRATTTKITVDDFSRTINVYSVYRDSNYRIQETGTLDQNTKKVTVTVSWKSKNATTTKYISTYLTNFN